VVEVLAEERERLDERAAAGPDLGTPARQQVHGRELLEDADGIVGAQHRHGTGQADPLGARGGAREDDGGRRHREVGAVMLADAEDVEPDLVGQLDLLQQVADAVPRRAGGQLAERVDADLHHAATGVRSTRSAASTRTSSSSIAPAAASTCALHAFVCAFTYRRRRGWLGSSSAFVSALLLGPAAQGASSHFY
jgi:hypothetical protein